MKNLKIDNDKLEIKMLESGIGTQAEFARRSQWSNTWASQTFQRIRAGEDVAMKTVSTICSTLKCHPADIIIRRAGPHATNV